MEPIKVKKLRPGAHLPTYERFFMVTFCFLVSWVLRMLVNTVAFSIVRAKYNRGIRKVL